MNSRLPSWRDIANMLAVELEPHAQCGEPGHQAGVTEGCPNCEATWALDFWYRKSGKIRQLPSGPAVTIAPAGRGVALIPVEGQPARPYQIAETKNAGWVLRCEACDITKAGMTEDEARKAYQLHLRASHATVELYEDGDTGD